MVLAYLELTLGRVSAINEPMVRCNMRHRMHKPRLDRPGLQGAQLSWTRG